MYSVFHQNMIYFEQERYCEQTTTRKPKLYLDIIKTRYINSVIISDCVVDGLIIQFLSVKYHTLLLSYTSMYYHTAVINEVTLHTQHCVQTHPFFDIHACTNICGNLCEKISHSLHNIKFIAYWGVTYIRCLSAYQYIPYTMSKALAIRDYCSIIMDINHCFFNNRAFIVKWSARRVGMEWSGLEYTYFGTWVDLRL